MEVTSPKGLSNDVKRHMKTSLACTNFIEVLIDSNIGNVDGKPEIVSTSHKLTILTLFTLIDPLLITILTIRVLDFFSTHFKGPNMLIHLVFTHFEKNSNLLFSQF
jgi:hypothetical protein